jgi:hypothetical protein
VYKRQVPYDRFQQVVASKNDLSGQLQAAQEQIQALTEKTATTDTVTAALAAANGRADAAEGKFDRWRAVSGALGTTDQEAIDAAEFAHSRLPAEDRPELPAWLSGLKEDPANAPKMLQPWIGAPAEPAAPTKSAPRAAKPTAQPPGAPSSVSADAMRAARIVGVRTGDWSQYKTLAKAAGYRTNAKD